MQKRRSAFQRLMLVALLPVMSLASGCVTQTGDCELLTLKAYDRDFNLRLEAERAATPNATWVVAVTDYAGLRDAVRACKGNK